MSLTTFERDLLALLTQIRDSMSAPAEPQHPQHQPPPQHGDLPYDDVEPAEVPLVRIGDLRHCVGVPFVDRVGSTWIIRRQGNVDSELVAIVSHDGSVKEVAMPTEMVRPVPNLTGGPESGDTRKWWIIWSNGGIAARRRDWMPGTMAWWWLSPVVEPEPDRDPEHASTCPSCGVPYAAALDYDDACVELEAALADVDRLTAKLAECDAQLVRADARRRDTRLVRRRNREAYLGTRRGSLRGMGDDLEPGRAL